MAHVQNVIISADLSNMRSPVAVIMSEQYGFIVKHDLVKLDIFLNIF